jgi:NADH-quinone oxidoreductase subunit J
MNASTIIFYLLATMTLVSALLSVTTRQIFRSAIYLLFTLIGIAGLYFWMEYEFVAAVQIVVYVGGIVVLIIFSIFLTQQAGELLPKQTIGRKVFSALAAFLGFALVMTQSLQHGYSSIQQTTVDSDVRAIGQQMLNIDSSGMALPFEVISILLLAAMIGCIVIAMRAKPETT